MPHNSLKTTHTLVYSMYVCMYLYVCMYVFMHACMYMYISKVGLAGASQFVEDNPHPRLWYVCMYVCMYARVYVHVCMCICMRDGDSLNTTHTLVYGI